MLAALTRARGLVAALDTVREELDLQLGRVVALLAEADARGEEP
jgi:hypothetical protein